MSDLQFSDEDLKRLKKDINMAPVDAEIHVQKCSALLARLEAAEKVCSYLGENSYSHILQNETEYLAELEIAWRKTAGCGYQFNPEPNTNKISWVHRTIAFVIAFFIA